MDKYMKDRICVICGDCVPYRGKMEHMKVHHPRYMFHRYKNTYVCDVCGHAERCHADMAIHFRFFHLNMISLVDDAACVFRVHGFKVPLIYVDDLDKAVSGHCLIPTDYRHSPCYGTHGNIGEPLGTCAVCKQPIYKVAVDNSK